MRFDYRIEDIIIIKYRTKIETGKILASPKNLKIFMKPGLPDDYKGLIKGRVSNEIPLLSQNFFNRNNSKSGMVSIMILFFVEIFIGYLNRGLFKPLQDLDSK